MILDSKLIYSGILRPVKEKEKLKKEKEERLTEIEQSQISPRKKNILNNVIVPSENWKLTLDESADNEWFDVNSPIKVECFEEGILFANF